MISEDDVVEWVYGQVAATGTADQDMGLLETAIDHATRDVRRRVLENTRLGRRVLCTDRHSWSTGHIVQAFRGQWKVEELFR